MLEFFLTYWDEYLVGLGVGLCISVISMFFAVILGTFGALGRASTTRWRWLASGYVAVFRGAPPLLLLYLVYFGIPMYARQSGNELLISLCEPLSNRIIAAVVAFSLSSGAYATEFIRAAIGAVGNEQIEAGRSIGFSQRQIFFRIIAPQAGKVAFPALTNEFISCLKGTSLASVIGVVELLRSAQVAASATFQNLTAYTLAGVYYILLVLVLQWVLKRAEDHLDPVWKAGSRDKRTKGRANLARA